ncbi:DUF885 domain-containing protein [Rubinisphaera sp. JC750]|uniref:DUF885 domain-containing protein n=1 Tax=Rubinisphaera sp. JC750 TaxID=2898658 RepID=UPI001F20BE93|nr:DUF885 domain-containing protein [Rubinisphaera sp. JC750]
MRIRSWSLRLICCVAWLSVQNAWAVETPEKENEATRQFQQLLEDHWEWGLKTDPVRATYLGDDRFDDQWQDLSLEAIQTRHNQQQQFRERLSEIDTAALSAEDKLNYRLFASDLDQRLAGFPYQWYLVPLTHRGGIQTEDEIVDVLSFETVQDYENWLARLRAFPEYMDQTITLMEQGVEKGIVQPKVVMKRVPAQIRHQIVDNPEASPFYKPFREMPARISKVDQKRLRKHAQEIIATQVVPSYKRFLNFFENDYYPNCFDEVGVWQIPDGQEFYALQARRYTTTDMTPQEIHDLGLAEVARIREQMEAIQREVGFEGSFREFLEHLRTDPKFYYDNENELFEAVQATCKKIDPQLVKLFKKLPRMPYGVEAIPAAVAPDTTAAYYRQPAADGTRAGTYFFNLYKPEERPKYTIEALSLHEAVPGHHLQIALAMELEGLPAFRRYGGYTAFIEGWGLYSESLGAELGLYQDPYSRFGQLTYEMWRAIRLVVDTGMHSLGWTRQQSVDLFLENTAKSRLDIENEVDRYIAWPGQALAYKIGELKIQELRKTAEAELGDAFDIREFHDVVLRNGAVPLDVLQTQVEDWIGESKGR